MSLPTTYQYYASGRIQAGLSADKPYFTLNKKNFTIYGGAMNYFRVHPEYWRDRLRKMRAAGLNTVTTYIPWNLHEFNEGVFDVGNGGSDFQQFLDIKKFLTIAQEEDLLAIVAPGPFICAEWEFGGFPAWLLRKKGIKVRTSDEVFMSSVRKYFQAILSILAFLQFTKGGPIIAFQIENSYGSVGHELAYLEGIKQVLLDNGIRELLIQSDSTSQAKSGQIPGVLSIAIIASNVEKQLALMQTYQPGKPHMVMQYFLGWFDHWTDNHHTFSTTQMTINILKILNYPAGINFFMFHGGTNFGFMNGANNNKDDNSGYQPTTNSYDYDAPVNEFGEYTKKYYKIRDILKAHGRNPIRIPDIPKLNIKRKQYPKLAISKELTFENLLKSMEKLKMKFKLKVAEPMELLPIPGGQKYGYIVYRKKFLDIPANSIIKILGHLTDTLMVLVNGKLQSPVLYTQADLYKFGYWRVNNGSLIIHEKCLNCTLDFIVENWGRVNYGGIQIFAQFKGLQKGQLLFNNKQLHDFLVYPLEFRSQYNGLYKNWQPYNSHKITGPKIYKAILKLDTESKYDTFIDMREWGKGIIIINNFVLSRYCKLGPQQTAYLPAPFLKKGDNVIMIFEHFDASDSIKFSESPIFNTP